MSLEFLITALIVVLVPGTGVVYTVAVGLGRGRQASVAAAFGCTLGIIPAILAFRRTKFAKLCLFPRPQQSD